MVYQKQWEHVLNFKISNENVSSENFSKSLWHNSLKANKNTTEHAYLILHKIFAVTYKNLCIIY